MCAMTCLAQTCALRTVSADEECGRLKRTGAYVVFELFVQDSDGIVHDRLMDLTVR